MSWAVNRDGDQICFDCHAAMVARNVREWQKADPSWYTERYVK
jgi:hypothetical protein